MILTWNGGCRLPSPNMRALQSRHSSAWVSDCAWDDLGGLPAGSLAWVGLLTGWPRPSAPLLEDMLMCGRSCWTLLLVSARLDGRKQVGDGTVGGRFCG